MKQELLLHLSEIDNLFLLCRRVNFDHAQRRPHTQRTIEDVNTKDDRISFRKASDGLQAARPYCLRSSIFALGLSDFRVVCRESVEKMIDDIR